jgi:uracil-DNA glycosylase family 4
MQVSSASSASRRRQTAGGWPAAFYRRSAGGDLVLSRTGGNLNDCLAVLGTTIGDVGFIEAVRCRPTTPGAWHPSEPVRRHCRRFLETHLLVTQPRLVLPLGLTATASCLEVAFARRPASLEVVVGKTSECSAPWGPCWILPLYHPSPVNGARWRRNKLFLQTFLKERLDAEPWMGGGAAAHTFVRVSAEGGTARL